VGPDGVSTTTYLYEGNTVKVTDPAGKWKKFTLDAFGQLVQVNEPNPAGGADYVTTYTYDRYGNLTTVSMPRPTGTQTRTFNWSAPGWLSSATNPENGTVSYTYNSFGKVASRSDAKGQLVSYSYDVYGRLTMVQRYAGGVEDHCLRETYSYDTNPYDPNFTQNGNGRLTAIQYHGGGTGFFVLPGGVPVGNHPCSATFTEMFNYNLGGGVLKKRLRVTRYYQTATSPYSASKTADLEQTNTYDLNSGTGMVHTLSSQYPKVQASSETLNPPPANGPYLGWTYDSMGRPATMTDLATSQGIISGVTFNVAGEMLAMTGQYAETRTYNALFQLTGIVAPGVSMSYAYSATQNNGKITSQTDNLTGETVQYAYDALNRLATAVATNNSWGQSYTYDGFGNLTGQTVIAGTAPYMQTTYNAATNRQNGECADLNGNINALPGCTNGYGYDIENRLTSAANAQYSYAPGNKRLFKRVGSTDEVTFYGISGQKLATYSMTFVSNTLTLTQTGTWYYFGGKLIKNAGGYIGHDRIGSVGNKFFPYGQEKVPTANNTEKFATYFRDSETGLDYAQNRYHQPGMGRFQTPDPYVASGGPEDPGSWNRYAYTRGDPLNRLDPAGTFDCPPDIRLCIAPMPGSGGASGGESGGIGDRASKPGTEEEVGIGNEQVNTGAQGVGLVAPAVLSNRLGAAITAAIDALANNKKCYDLFTGGPGFPEDPIGVLQNLQSGGKYGSIGFGTLISAPGTVRSATTAGVTVTDGTQTYDKVEIVINNFAGSFVTGSARDQAVTILHELGHAMNELFGPATAKRIVADGRMVKEGMSGFLLKTEF
jgi:RHS repeat-associated protein